MTGRERVASCIALIAAVGLLGAAATACAGDDQVRVGRAAALGAQGVEPAGRPVAMPTPFVSPADRARDDSVYADAAARAWRFVARNYVPATGLVRPFDTYPISTVWDMASGLAAIDAAARLGLITQADFDQRMSRALATLERVTLFENMGFNKEYRVTDGAVIDVSRRPGRRGYGVSATDHGRMLLVLRAVANAHPSQRAAAERVVARLDLGAFINDGYLGGRQVSTRTGKTRGFHEGRIGYEQYAARGFAVWGARAEGALDITRNRQPRDVEGVTVAADTRGLDRLTSEPFVLLGLEHGWTAAEQQEATAVLAAQAARHRRTGELTMVSEDAIDRAPDYFFYYGVLTQHGPFTIDVQRPNVRVSGPRWVSAKAAFGWHALVPDAYTRLVVDSVAARAGGKGGDWGSGVFEDGKPTANPNLNTAAVILESALYRRTGKPMTVGAFAIPADSSAKRDSASVGR